MALHFISCQKIVHNFTDFLFNKKFVVQLPLCSAQVEVHTITIGVEEGCGCIDDDDDYELYATQVQVHFLTNSVDNNRAPAP